MDSLDKIYRSRTEKVPNQSINRNTTENRENPKAHESENTTSLQTATKRRDDLEVTSEAPETRKKHKHKRAYPSTDQIEAYWVERKRYLEKMKKVPELRGKYLKAFSIYMLRRVLWSFGFFPVFLSFWIPLVLARFNPVAMISDLLPSLQRFVSSNPEIQASTIETLFIAWFSIGFIFAVFDFVLTPFKSPYEYEADVHMRAWEELQKRNLPST